MRIIKNRWFVYGLGGVILAIIVGVSVWLLIKDKYSERIIDNVKYLNIMEPARYYMINKFAITGEKNLFILLVYIIPIILVESIYTNIILIIEQIK